MMRITFVLFILCASTLWATESNSQTARTDISLEGATILDIIASIEEQTDYLFVYDKDEIDINRRVNISAKDQSVASILSSIFDNTDNIYAMEGSNIFLMTKSKSIQQQLVITGVVIDQNGESLPGVNITVKGTTVGVMTDFNGKYSITIPDRTSTLQFSFVGYQSQEIVAGTQSVINVTLQEDVQMLDEVIVVGYGTQKKSDLTGSVVRVDMDEKSTLANVSISQALSGASAGINIQSVGGAGSDPTMSIRGQNTLSAGTSPLIVVDGIIYNGSISAINLNDVETIDILKDASAAAVYGSRSANGVMLITTKKGKTEKPVISFNMYTGVQDMTNNPMKVMNSEQYYRRLIDYYYQMDDLYPWYRTMPTSDEGKPQHPTYEPTDTNVGRLKSAEEQDNYRAGYEINWVDEVTRTAPISNYNLSVSGKSDRTTYYLSGSYTDESGILKGDDFSRLTVLSNLESKITDWLTIGANLSYSFMDYSGLSASLANARTCSPLADNVYGQNGNYNYILTGEII